MRLYVHYSDSQLHLNTLHGRKMCVWPDTTEMINVRKSFYFLKYA